MLHAFTPSLISVFIFVNIIYFIGKYLGRRDIADVVWGLGISIAAWTAYFAFYQTTLGLIINICISLWALRLALHIGERFVSKKVEDPRYLKFSNPYVYVFLLQGFLMIIVAASAILLSHTNANANLNIFTIVGLIIFVIGLGFEAIGDYQLRAFLKDKNNAGEIMTSGLWSYTRHPNYFGEVFLWWGLWTATLGNNSLLAIISPLTISYLILKVSGIPMTEARYKDNAEFQEYAKKTNAFFPWFPKKS